MHSAIHFVLTNDNTFCITLPIETTRRANQMASRNHGIADHMAYILIGRSISKTYVIDRYTEELDRETTVKDIAGGQYDQLIQVLEINPVEGTCRDVTEDIGREVMTLWADEGEPLCDWQLDFVENFCGMQAAAAFRRAA